MWFLTLHRWIADGKQNSPALLDDHLSWMTEQMRAGKVLIAGPSTDIEIGVIVFGEMPREQLVRLVRTEPFTAAGLRDFEVIPWEVHQLFGVDTHGRNNTVTADGPTAG